MSAEFAGRDPKELACWNTLALLGDPLQPRSVLTECSAEVQQTCSGQRGPGAAQPVGWV